MKAAVYFLVDWTSVNTRYMTLIILTLIYQHDGH